MNIGTSLGSAAQLSSIWKVIIDTSTEFSDITLIIDHFKIITENRAVIFDTLKVILNLPTQLIVDSYTVIFDICTVIIDNRTVAL